jgi:3-isopropylmalate dehydrogenase
MAVTLDVLKQVGSQLDLEFTFQEALIGGAAIDATGGPLPEETLTACRDSDAVLLAAIGGYKWDTLPRELRLRLDCWAAGRARSVCQPATGHDFAPAD